MISSNPVGQICLHRERHSLSSRAPTVRFVVAEGQLTASDRATSKIKAITLISVRHSHTVCIMTFISMLWVEGCLYCLRMTHFLCLFFHLLYLLSFPLCLLHFSNSSLSWSYSIPPSCHRVLCHDSHLFPLSFIHLLSFAFILFPHTPLSSQIHFLLISLPPYQLLPLWFFSFFSLPLL